MLDTIHTPRIHRGFYRYTEVQMCGNCIFSTLKQNESNKFYNRQKRNSFTARIIAYKRLNVWGLLMVKFGLKLDLLFVQSSIKDFFSKCDQIRKQNFENCSTWPHLYFWCHYFCMIITILLCKACWQAGGTFSTLKICKSSCRFRIKMIISLNQKAVFIFNTFGNQ